MYGSLNFGVIDVTQITNYIADLWNMFQPVAFLVLGIAGFGALIGVVLTAFIRGLRGG